MSKKHCFGLIAVIAFVDTNPAVALDMTTISMGFDYASGQYGTDQTTDIYSLPISIKYETGPWTLRANLPLVRAEGTFSRDIGASNRGSQNDNSRTESGIGDLTLGAFYKLINASNGYNLDIGGKAKIATADEKKTLITSGKNDYSVQLDVFQMTSGVSLFATLGYTLKGEPVGVDYKNPFFSSLGLSIPLASGHSFGAAWNYRQKLRSGDDPVSEVSVHYSMKQNVGRWIQFYVVHGLSNGSPEIGGGAALSKRF